VGRRKTTRTTDHPMFELFVQHGVIPVLQAGRPASQEFPGIKAYEINVATTVPIGWKVDRAARRYRRFC
jgi:hypothetical protein